MAIDKNKFRTATLKRKNLDDVATLRELTWLILNDLGTLADSINTPTYPSYTTAQRTALAPTAPTIVYDSDLDAYFHWSTVTSTWTSF